MLNCDNFNIIIFHQINFLFIYEKLGMIILLLIWTRIGIWWSKCYYNSQINRHHLRSITSTQILVRNDSHRVLLNKYLDGFQPMLPCYILWKVGIFINNPKFSNIYFLNGIYNMQMLEIRSYLNKPFFDSPSNAVDYFF